MKLCLKYLNIVYTTFTYLLGIHIFEFKSYCNPLLRAFARIVGIILNELS